MPSPYLSCLPLIADRPRPEPLLIRITLEGDKLQSKRAAGTVRVNLWRSFANLLLFLLRGPSVSKRFASTVENVYRGNIGITKKTILLSSFPYFVFFYFFSMHSYGNLKELKKFAIFTGTSASIRLSVATA